MAMLTNQDTSLSVGFDKLAGSIAVSVPEVQQGAIRNLKLIAEAISNQTGHKSHHLLRAKGGYKFSIQLPPLEGLGH